MVILCRSEVCGAFYVMELIGGAVELSAVPKEINREEVMREKERCSNSLPYVI
jgi:hypothetical protein